MQWKSGKKTPWLLDPAAKAAAKTGFAVCAANSFFPPPCSPQGLPRQKSPEISLTVRVAGVSLDQKSLSIICSEAKMLKWKCFISRNVGNKPQPIVIFLKHLQRESISLRIKILGMGSFQLLTSDIMPTHCLSSCPIWQKGRMKVLWHNTAFSWLSWSHPLMFSSFSL